MVRLQYKHKTGVIWFGVNTRSSQEQCLRIHIQKYGKIRATPATDLINHPISVLRTSYERLTREGEVEIEGEDMPRL